MADHDLVVIGSIGCNGEARQQGLDDKQDSAMLQRTLSSVGKIGPLIGCRLVAIGTGYFRTAVWEFRLLR